MMGKASLTIQIGGEYNNRAIAKAQQDLKNFELETARTSGGVSGSLVSMGDKLVATGAKVTSFGDGMTAAGVKVTAMTAPLAAAGIAATKMAVDFEDAMAKVDTIADTTEVPLDELRTQILQLSSDTGIAATDIADNVYNAISAGQKTGDAVAFVGNAAKLAKAGFTDSASALDVLTTTLNAYKLEADQTARVSDVLLMTQNKGKTSVGELASSMGKAIPTAAAFNVNLENLAAAYATTTANGIATAESTTYIKGMIKELGDTGSVVGTIIKDKTGKSFSELMTEGKSLGDALNILNEHGQETNQTMYDMFGSAEAAGAAATLASGNASQFTENLEAMNNAAGSTDSAFSKMETTSYTVEKAINKLKNVALDTGNTIVGSLTPAIDSFADGAQEFAEWFSSLDDGTKQTIVTLGMVAVAAGPVLVVGGKIISTTGKIITTVGKGTQAFGVFVNKLKTTGTALEATNASTKKLDATAKTAATTTAKYGTSMKTAGASATAMTTATKSATTATKASTIAMNAGSVAAKGMGTALKACVPIAIISLVMELVSGLSDMAEHAQLVEDATTGMTGALSEAESAYNSYTPAVEDSTAAMESASASAEECLQSQAELAKTMRETWADYGTNAAMVDTYAATIQELGDKGNLTAEEQERLKLAVEGFNSVTGESVSIINAQTGELSMQRDAILQTAEAYKEEAKAAALRELYQATIKQLVQDEQALKQATEELNSAEEGFGLWIGDFPVFADEASVKYHELQQNVNDLTAATDSARSTSEEYLSMLVNGTTSFDTFEGALASAGASMESFGNIGEEQLSALQSSFDGSLNSIVSACATQGVQIPSALANSIMENSGLATDAQRVMFDALVLQMTGGDVEAAAEALGHDIDEGLRAGIEGSSDMPAEAVGVMSDEVINRAKEHFDSHSPSVVMQQLGNDIDAGLANGITEMSSQPTEAMTLVNDGVQQSIAGLPDYATTTGSTSGFNLASALGSFVESVGISASSLSSSAQNGIAGLTSAMSAAGTTGGSSVASGLGGYAGAVGTAASSLVNSARNGISTMPTIGSNVGTTAGSNLSSGLTRQAGSVQTAARRLATSAEKGLESSKTGFARAGQTAAKAYADAIGNYSATSQGRKLAQSAETGIKSVQGRQAGVDFAMGYGNGISSMNSWVYQKAYALAQQAVNAVKAAQKSASPSKVAHGLGGDFGTGYGNGMEATTGYVAKKGAGLTAAAIDGLSEAPVTTWEIPWYGGAAAAQPANSKTYNVNIYINGSKVESGISSGMDDALEQVISEAERYVNMGVGYGY